MNGRIALGALGGIGLIATVSVASSRSGSSDPSWTKGIPSFSFLSSNKAFMNITQDNPSSRFGYRYADLLVEDSDANNDWWKWSYENLREDLKNNENSLLETFRPVSTSQTTPNSVDSLRSWCSEVYRANTNLNKPFDAPGSIFHNTSVWKYCSPMQKPPVSLAKSRVNYLNQTVGKEMAEILLALDGNDRIWHYRNKFFTGISVDKFTDETSHATFIKGRKNGRKIKDVCADIYEKVESEMHSDFFTFCSISQTL